MNPLTALDTRLVIAHRGNAAHAPENTLEAFDQAIALGVDALELDVQVTRDGVPIVIHDPTLSRTAGQPHAVATLTAAELRDADAGATFTRDEGASFPYRRRGLTIPTFAEVLARYRETPLLVEVKVPEAAGAVARVLDEAGAGRRTVVASMLDAAVVPFRGGAFATGASGNDVVRLLWHAFLPGGPTRLPYNALCIPRWYYGIPLPVVGLARAGRRAGAATHVWTVDDPRIAKRLWAAGIQGIVTNDPATMIKARKELQTSTR
jgi:glycerophosphoryl diester phosphodiesterase